MCVILCGLVYLPVATLLGSMECAFILMIEVMMILKMPTLQCDRYCLSLICKVMGRGCVLFQVCRMLVLIQFRVWLMLGLLVLKSERKMSFTSLCWMSPQDTTRGVTVSMSAFLACHQCYCVGLSPTSGLESSGFSMWHFLKHFRMAAGENV